MAWKDGKMVEGRVHSAAGQECRMYLPDAKLVEVKKSKGGKVAFYAGGRWRSGISYIGREELPSSF